MFDKWRFYFKHSINDLRVNKKLTAFALLAIASGVAAIVSLQTLAVMIGHALEGNLQETNRGDISVTLIDVDLDQGLDQGPSQTERAAERHHGEHLVDLREEREEPQREGTDETFEQAVDPQGVREPRG